MDKLIQAEWQKTVEKFVGFLENERKIVVFSVSAWYFLPETATNLERFGTSAIDTCVDFDRKSFVKNG